MSRTNKIVFLILATMCVGFVVSVLIPRLVIDKIGQELYGYYALVVGFAGVLALADFGLLPGVTREASKFSASRNYAELVALIASVNRMAGAAVIGLGLCCFAACSFLVNIDTSSLIQSLIIFSFIGYMSVRLDVLTAVARSEGRVEQTYYFRLSFFALHLVLVMLSYKFISAWSIELVLILQLTALTLVERTMLLWARRRWKIDIRSVSSHADRICSRISLPWNEIWRVSGPERKNKVLQMVNGLFERPLLMATTGALFVGNFDLMMRLMLFVTVIPGALNQPLLAMLSHDAHREHGERRFGDSFRLVQKVGAATALLGAGVALIIYFTFYEKLYGVSSLMPSYIVVLVAITSGVNVLTAPGATRLLATGVVAPASVKMFIEGSGWLLAALAGIVLDSALVFLSIRYFFLLISAVYFLYVERRY